MNLNRRNVLIGLGSIAAGAGTLAGTGAFTSVTATRDATINVAGDAGALLSVQAADGPNAAEYVSTKDSGEVAIDLSTGTGSGVNPNAVTEVDDLLILVNQGTQPVDVWFTDDSDVVTFRTGEDSIDGPGNSVLLEVGEQIAVGATIDTTETDADQLLSTVTIHAGKTSPAQGTSPRQLYVDNNAAGDAPNVYTTVQGAIESASGGETINVAASSTPYAAFDVNKAVTVVGENAFPSNGGSGGDTYVLGDAPGDTSEADTDRVKVSAAGAVLKDFRISGDFSGSDAIVEISGGNALIDGVNLDDINYVTGTQSNQEVLVTGPGTTITNSRVSRAVDQYGFPAIYTDVSGVSVLNTETDPGKVGANIESGETLTIRGNTLNRDSIEPDVLFVTGGFDVADLTVEQNNFIRLTAEDGNGFYRGFDPAFGLSGAAGRAADGATISIPPVKIDEPDEITIDNSGVTVQASRSERPVLNTNGITVASSTSGVTVRDLEIRSDGNQELVLGGTDTSAINNKIVRSVDSAVGAFATGTNGTAGTVTISENVSIAANANARAGPISIYNAGPGFDAVVNDNRIEGVSTEGIFAFGSEVQNMSLDINGNEVSDFALDATDDSKDAPVKLVSIPNTVNGTATNQDAATAAFEVLDANTALPFVQVAGDDYELSGGSASKNNSLGL